MTREEREDIILLIKQIIRITPGLAGADGATGPPGPGDMESTNNLSDVVSASASRTNLGLDTTANQSDSANKRFVTDADLVDIGNLSGTNTGDNATNSQYSGLAASKMDVTAFSGLAKITVGTTEPVAPGTGDLWIDTN